MRNSRSFSAIFVAAFACSSFAPGTALAQTTPAPTMDDAIAAIAAFAPRALAEQGAPGMTLAITDRAHTIKIIDVGYADVDAKQPVTDATRFPIGSLSKGMTAIALLELHDRGEVDLNAPVQRYLPWWSIQSDGHPILVHQLLSHTAGIPDDYSFVAAYGFDIAVLRNAHTLFTPGTKWSYSNDGFATVGAIVAAVAREPWRDAIAQNVFAPIGMSDSSAYFTPALLSNTAVGYLQRDADRPTPPNPALIPAQSYDFVDPAGSVISTPADMARYIRFYLNGGKTESGRQLLAPATFEKMTDADTYNNGKPDINPGTEMSEWPAFYKEYGYGLSIFHTDGDHLIGHTGGVSGYTACMQANLTRGFGAIAMSNLVEAPLHPCAIVRYAMAVLRAQSLGKPLPPQPAPPVDPAVIAHAGDYAGTYTASDGNSVRVTTRGKRLALVDGGTPYRLLSRGPGRFWTADPRFPLYLIAFARDKAKAVDEFTYGPDLYANSRYVGPRSFPYPKRYDALTGRYEAVVWGTALVIRVVIVKGRLTLDGVSALAPQPDGTFLLGESHVRFDTPAGARMQRMWIDAGDLYRVELP